METWALEPAVGALMRSCMAFVSKGQQPVRARKEGRPRGLGMPDVRLGLKQAERKLGLAQVRVCCCWVQWLEQLGPMGLQKWV